jgi:hypothetical protein
VSWQTLPAHPCAPLTQIWAHLASDLQDQAIRLMAQLALNLVAAQSDWLGKEYTRDPQSHQTKDSF